MRLAAVVIALASFTSLATARPITAGASLGRIQSKANADGEASDTYQLFGRIGLTSRLGAQLELQKIEDPDLDVRSGTALLVVELAAPTTRWMPMIIAGMGLDRASNDWYDASGSHIEGGFALEYRADGGFTIGADLRLGGRSVEEQTEYYPALEGDIALYAPYGLAEGEYRSARLYAAIRF